MTSAQHDAGLLTATEQSAADFMESSMEERFETRVGKALHARFGNAPGEYLAAMYGVRGYVEGVRTLTAENAKLRRLLQRWNAWSAGHEDDLPHGAYRGELISLQRTTAALSPATEGQAR